MKILFSNGPWFVREEGKPLRKGVRVWSRSPNTNEANHAPFPLFMGYAASYLSEKMPQCEVMVRDSIARGESYETFLAFLEDWHPAFVVVESDPASWAHDADLIEQMRSVLTHAKFILCGPIAMTDPAPIFEIGIWALVRGEYTKGIEKAVRGQSGLIEHRGSPEVNEPLAIMMDEWSTAVSDQART